jgi:hypothetical protein
MFFEWLRSFQRDNPITAAAVEVTMVGLGYYLTGGTYPVAANILKYAGAAFIGSHINEATRPAGPSPLPTQAPPQQTPAEQQAAEELKRIRAENEGLKKALEGSTLFIKKVAEEFDDQQQVLQGSLEKHKQTTAVAAKL